VKFDYKEHKTTDKLQKPDGYTERKRNTIHEISNKNSSFNRNFKNPEMFFFLGLRYYTGNSTIHIVIFLF
jgi:hypothetical protein